MLLVFSFPWLEDKRREEDGGSGGGGRRKCIDFVSSWFSQQKNDYNKEDSYHPTSHKVSCARPRAIESKNDRLQAKPSSSCNILHFFFISLKPKWLQGFWRETVWSALVPAHVHNMNGILWWLWRWCMKVHHTTRTNKPRRKRWNVEKKMARNTWEQNRVEEKGEIDGEQMFF